MIPKSITITEAARGLSEYVNRVAYRREAFILYRGGKPTAELRPVPMGMRLGDLAEVLRSLPHLTKDEANEFAADLDAGRKAKKGEKLRDPWAS